MSISRVSSIAWTATGVTAVLAFLLGLDPVTLWATTNLGYLTVPPSVGVPLGPPAFQPGSFGALGTSYALTESLAALVLVGTVFWRLARHPRTPLRSIATTWWAFTLGSAAAGIVRGLATAHAAYADAPASLTYTLSGTLSGLLWGLTLGWLPALTTATLTRTLPTPI